MRSSPLPLKLLLLAANAAVSVNIAVFNGVAQTPAAPKPPRVAYYVNPALKDLGYLLPAPPTQDSDQTRVELAELHAMEESRTPEQVKAAQADDAEEDIFIFRRVLGEGFEEKKLPVTAALSRHVHRDEGVASLPAKATFQRPRPYQYDKSLHPVCKLTEEPNSYPSGHTISGYLEAFTLAELVPEKRLAILARADDYAHNRLVCGVHYRSDTVTGRVVAYAMFGSMMGNPVFQKDMAAARAEIAAAGLGGSATMTASEGTGMATTAMATDGLAGNTVLIIRHSEKPETGTGLTAAGEARARAYATYFAPFRENKLSLKVDALYAGADSAKSFRPRLTMEPLSKATGIPIHSEIATQNSEAMVKLLRTSQHGKTPLIAWRHGELPALVSAFGADGARLIPGGKWPDEIFDWVIVLQFDEAGKLMSQAMVKQTLVVGQ